MAHNCRVPSGSAERTWVCPVCKSPWTLTSRKQARRSRNENIRVDGRRPFFMGR